MIVPPLVQEQGVGRLIRPVSYTHLDVYKRQYHDLDGWRTLLQAAGFEELEHYYRPDGLPRDQQPWLASVWRRVE